MKIYQKILFAIFIIYGSNIVTAQPNDKVNIGLAAELLNRKSWGGVASFSGEINYSVSKIYSVSGLYRRGKGFGWFGAVEHRTAMDDDVPKYNEISFYLNYNFDDSILRLYFGGGVGLLWGNKQNEEDYSIVGFPFVVGNKIKIFNDFEIGLKFIGNINTKTIFTGFGLSLFYNI